MSGNIIKDFFLISSCIRMPEENCKPPPDPKQKAFRSEKMLELLQAVIGEDLNKYPVAPLTKWLNGRILSAERGHIKMTLSIRPEMANPTGILHGGIQSAILDDAIGICCATLGEEGFHLSIDMHIDYLGRAAVGEDVIAEAEIVREGKNIVNAKASLKDSKGNYVATAHSNLLITSKKPSFHNTS
jgi:uncharacterized protein (TIGR00369 family)